MSTRINALHVLQLVAAICDDGSGPGLGIQTPQGCDGCEYRQEDWRDGGWCYMFKEAPTPTCART